MAYDIVNGQEIESNLPPTQVYKATHDGAGNRLPYMYRSFISFTYGGKNIEDFGLIAVTEGNGLTRNLSADFNDIVTSPEVMDGRFYWGTHYNNNALELALFTDCITQKQLDEFKLWFQPGVEKELILAENPFRGIMARVGAVSTMSMIPVEYPVKMKLAGQEYNTKITKYQGSIRLSFVMDDPFWYSLANILDYQVDGNTAEGSWRGIDNNPVTITNSPDALKVIYEDRIPILAMFDESTGAEEVGYGDKIIKKEGSKGAYVVSKTSSQEDRDLAAHISGYKNGITWSSRIGIWENAVSGETSSYYDFSPGRANRKYFYYAGTAPSLPTIEFSFSVDNDCFNSASYFKAIQNSYAVVKEPYSTITIEGVDKHELKITTPSLFTSYNQAVRILKSSFSTDLELKEALRDGVHHKMIRDMAINSYNLSHNKNSTISLLKSALITLNYFTVIINCKTGAVRLKYQNSLHEDIEEDAGDMILSNYLKITERNHFTDEGFIGRWDDDKEFTQILYHNLGCLLTQFKFIYKHMYL